QVKDLMTPDPVCCSKDARLPEVARMMRETDCGAIPVVDDDPSGHKLVGIITDRDIVVRGIADNADLLKLTAGDCMSLAVATVTPETSLEDCEHLMEARQVRRVPVVDNKGNCCGIVAQADLALHAPLPDTGEVLREISVPVQPVDL